MKKPPINVRIFQINVTRFKRFPIVSLFYSALGFSFAQFSDKSLYHCKVDVNMIVDLLIDWQILGFDFQFQSQMRHTV